MRNDTENCTLEVKSPSARYLGDGEHPPDKKSNSQQENAAWAPNLFRPNSMECNKWVNVKKKEIKRKSKKAHNGLRRTMPPVRHEIADSHGERADIGDVFVGDGKAHLNKTFEPIANRIERELTEFR